eukprot:sb/3464354/
MICSCCVVEQLKELDVEEFLHCSVVCFVEACYSGSVEITRDNFREVNKLSAVFQVQWMVGECLKFYTDLCSRLTSQSVAWFLFEEAAYMLKERNNRDLQDALSSNLGETLRMELVQYFLSRDPNKQDYWYTHLCLSLAGEREVRLLYKWFIENLEGKPHPVELNDIEKGFLTLISLTMCFRADQALYLQLVTSVQRSLSKEDLLSLFDVFARVAAPPPNNGVSNPQNTMVYPIVIPALGECKTFLDAVKVIDKERRIRSCTQFSASLDYCCDVFGGYQLSPEIVQAITAGMDKRSSGTSLWGFPLLDSNHREIANILWNCMIDKQDSEYRLANASLKISKQSFPIRHSERLFLVLHGFVGPSYCDDNPEESDKRCKVAVDVSVTLEDKLSWPVVKLSLVEDQENLEAPTDAHLHQDPDFLQHIYVRVSERPNASHIAVCSNLNTLTPSLDKIHGLWKLSSYDIAIFWPRIELD